MTIHFRYGNYQHPPGEVSLTITQAPVLSPRGDIQSVKHTWNISGELIITGDETVDHLTAKITALEAAYSDNGLNAGYYFQNGSQTAHYLNSSAAMGGVIVTNRSFPQGSGIEYATQRTFAVTLEAEFPNTNLGLISFAESVSFEGTGGPRRIFIPVINGPPEEQIVYQRTTARAVQSGSAVGYTGYPAPPPPIWPQMEIQEARRIERRTPRIYGRTRTEWGISWQYVFESASPLSGNPTIR